MDAGQSVVHATDAAPLVRGRPRGGWFLAALVGATLLPLLSLPVLAKLEFPFDGSLLLGLAVLAGGTGHVASTASVYADRSVRDLMRSMPRRFYVLPAAALLLTAGLLVWGERAPIADEAIAVMFLVHLLWLHHHYQKQNYGLVAFAGASIGQRVPFRLAHVLLLPALAGCLAVMPTLLSAAFPSVSFWRPAAGAMKLSSMAAYAAGGLAMVALIRRHPPVFRRPRVAVSTAGAFGFFLPAVLLEDSEYAFWSYALAHGFQYLLMVFLLGRGPRRAWLHGVTFTVCVVLGGLLLHKLVGNNALFACGILLTWVHFLLDARLWKMSQPGPRALIRERFAFLFRGK